jgi:hypothetical protein
MDPYDGPFSLRAARANGCGFQEGTGPSPGARRWGSRIGHSVGEEIYALGVRVGEPDIRSYAVNSMPYD